MFRPILSTSYFPPSSSHSLPNLQSIKPNDVFSHCTHVHDIILASMLTPPVFMKVIVCVTYLSCFALCFLPTHPWVPLPCRVFFIITPFGSKEQLHVQVEIHISWTFHVPSLLTSTLLCKILVVASVMHLCMTEEDGAGKIMPIVLFHTIIHRRANSRQGQTHH